MERTPVAHDDFTPLLTTTDWNEEWKALQQRRRPPDDAAWWDKRAATFRTHDAPSAYTWAAATVPWPCLWRPRATP